MVHTEAKRSQFEKPSLCRRARFVTQLIANLCHDINQASKSDNPVEQLDALKAAEYMYGTQGTRYPVGTFERQVQANPRVDPSIAGSKQVDEL